MRILLLTTLLMMAQPVPGPKDYFKINVVDQDTGRGVPLVELTTVNNLRYYTDSNGIVAFHEPGLMDQTVYFGVSSHGYEFAKDGFGFRGARLKVTPGGNATLKIKRLNIAERLYRLTGGGIYADSVLTGESVPIKQPVLNAQVFGQDSVLNTIYQDKLYWFWGDTNRPSYPLGNFHAPGAISLLPGKGGLDPEVGVDLEYFVNKDGFVKPTAQMPGKGPTWLGGLVVLDDPVSKKERMFAHYARVEQDMKIYERGLMEWTDEKKEFEKRAQFDLKAPMFPDGHPFKHVDQGTEFVYFTHPYPLVRVAATPTALLDLTKYQAYTCFKQGSRAESPQLDRDAQGKLRWSWKTDTPPLTVKLQNELVKSGKLKAEEGIFQLQEADSGKKIQVHGSSVYWNEYRKRWVMIALELFGTSVLGEIWYAEADSPVGPWRYARKVVTHNKYDFYNPKQHPMFARKGGQIIFFEGTYTNTFSGNPEATPRYNYNQIMYRLDLADPRLMLPVPVYRLNSAAGALTTSKPDKGKLSQETIAFYALDRAKPGSVPVLIKKPGAGFLLQVGTDQDADAENCAFFALPAAMKDPPQTAVPLYEWVHKGGQQRYYGIGAKEELPGFQRQEQPLCLVWRK